MIFISKWDFLLYPLRQNLHLKHSKSTIFKVHKNYTSYSKCPNSKVKKNNFTSIEYNLRVKTTDNNLSFAFSINFKI